jgi:hypothetical protein
MKKLKISFQQIFEYFQEYLETLPDNDDDEAYQSSRSFAEWQVGDFLFWLYKEKFSQELPKFALEKALIDLEELNTHNISDIKLSHEFLLIENLLTDKCNGTRTKEGLKTIKNLVVKAKNKNNKKTKIQEIII